MKKIMGKKVSKTVSILTVMAFLSSFCLPTTIAGEIQKSDNRYRLSKFILDVTGGFSAEEILTIIKTTIPVSDDKADEILFALNGLLATTLDSGSEIEPAQSAACTNATLLFMTGLTFVLLSNIISKTVTPQTECIDEKCLGGACICFKEETTTPLSEVTKTLRVAGNVIIILGVLGYAQNCLLNPEESVVDNDGITE